MKASWKTSALLAAGLIGALATAAVVLAEGEPRAANANVNTTAPANLNQASYLPDGKLKYPPDAESWTVLGASIGGDYREGEFDPKRPGSLGVVQIEPNALRVLRETGRYPDGAMLLLTFYRPQSKTEPQLAGFVQGEVLQREIHVIDRQRFKEEGRAFFVFPGTTSQAGDRMQLGSGCVTCHNEHGQLDGTFTQFYPPLRQLE